MNTHFQLDRDSSILIYGAAAIGVIIHNICEEKGISVKGFIDKRGDEISYLCGLRVWSLSDGDIEKLDKNVVVFIAVKNVFEHDNIVRKLLEYGFNNIIYRPYAVIKGEGTEEEKQIYNAYDKFMSKDIEFPWIPLPRTFKIYSYNLQDCSIIKTEGKYITVYVPLECLFTDNKGVKTSRTWADLPVMTLIPHIDFFKYLDGENGYSYHHYLNYCITAAESGGQIKVTDRWIENVIKNRADVYENMSLSLERDFDFFVRNAPAGEWNPKGYFNLISGKHRATFFLAKGRQYFPLKISEDDYKNWVNKTVLNELADKFIDLDIQECHAPVEHPYFYNMRCNNRSFYYRLLCSFVYNIALQQYELNQYINLHRQEDVLVSLNDDGYMARNLQKYGIGVRNYNKSILSKLLDELISVKETPVGKVGYAILEYKFGMEICFEELIKKNLLCIVVIVRKKDLIEFEKEDKEAMNIVKIQDGYIDGDCVQVFWLTNQDNYIEEK